MVVSTEWVNEHQKVVAVAKDTEENRQKGSGDLLMENKHLLPDKALKNNPKLTMTDALITDQEIAILCDVLEGWGANFNAAQIKRRFLISLLRRDLSCLLTNSRLQNTNLPAKLNNFSPSAASD